MHNRIRIARGTKADLQSVTENIPAGVPIYTTDENKLYIGREGKKGSELEAINAKHADNVTKTINGKPITGIDGIFEKDGTTVKLALNVVNPPARKIALLDDPVLLPAQSGMQDILFNQDIIGGDTIEIWYTSNPNITSVAQGERYSLVNVQVKTCSSSSGGGIGAIGSGFFRDIGEIWSTDKSSQYDIYPGKISLTAMQKSGPSYEPLYIGQIYKLNY